MLLGFMGDDLPPDISLGDIFSSLLPFIALQILALAFLIVFPQIAMWPVS